jgi:non-ribosomal peptide synthetase component F
MAPSFVVQRVNYRLQYAVYAARSIWSELDFALMVIGPTFAVLPKTIFRWAILDQDVVRSSNTGTANTRRWLDWFVNDFTSFLYTSF